MPVTAKTVGEFVTSYRPERAKGQAPKYIKRRHQYSIRAIVIHHAFVTAWSFASAALAESIDWPHVARAGLGTSEPRSLGASDPTDTYQVYKPCVGGS